MIHKQKNRRSTRQKRLIFDAVMNSDNHPSANDIYTALADSGIGIATIYRQLSNLVDDGSITSFEFQNETRYDPVMKPHAHIVCSVCNKIWDVDLPDEINSFAPSNESFEGVEVDLTWKGVCSECR